MSAIRFCFLVSLSLAMTRGFDYYGQTTYCPPGGVPVCATNGMQTKYFANQCQMDLLNMKMQIPYIATSLSNCMSSGRQVNAYASVGYSPVRQPAYASIGFSPVRQPVYARYPSYGGYSTYPTSSTESSTTESTTTESTTTESTTTESTTTESSTTESTTTDSTTAESSTIDSSTDSTTDSSLSSSTESSTVASSTITIQQLMLNIQFPSGWSFNMTILAPLSTNSISTPSVVLRLINKEAC